MTRQAVTRQTVTRHGEKTNGDKTNGGKTRDDKPCLALPIQEKVLLEQLYADKMGQVNEILVNPGLHTRKQDKPPYIK